MNFVFKVFIFIFCLNTLNCQGQETVLGNFERHAFQNKDNSILFVHFDKTDYSNFDKVYFTAYLIKSRALLLSHTVLYLSLVRNKDNSVVYQDKFLIEKGFSFGEFKMPDSVVSGNYRFVVNTDVKVNGKPEMEFVQPIVVKSLYIDPLVSTATLKTVYDGRTKEGFVLLKTMTNNQHFVEGAEVEYSINTGRTVIKKGNFKTNVIGEGIIGYPAEEIILDSSYISFKISKDIKPADKSSSVITNNTVTRYLKFIIPKVKDLSYSLNFYPEGGYLVNGLNSKIGFELKNSEGDLVNGSVIILKNNIPIDTVKSNSVGIGKFSLRPQAGIEYTAKLLDEKISKQVFRLPKALDSGCVLSVPDAVVDSVLFVKVQANKEQRFTFFLHNYRDVFAFQTLNVKTDKAVQIKFELKAVPHGLNTITVLDSLNRPVAERIFFANYSSITPVKIELDTVDFGLRSEVKVNLSIVNQSGALKEGLVSIACVKADKVSNLYSQNIPDYVYLDDNLKGVPLHPRGYKMGDKDFLEDVLLVKYWSRYKWTESIKKDSSVSIGSYKFTGRIFKDKNPLKENKELAVISGTSFKLLPVNNAGFFAFKNEDIFKTGDKKIMLSVNGEKNGSYKFELKDPLDSIKTYLTKSNYTDPFFKMYRLNETVQKQSLSDGIKLKEVTIKSAKEIDDDIFSLKTNKCGDYVCSNNILNCPNHFGDPRNSIPIEGRSYTVYVNDMRNKTIYINCQESVRDVNTIQLIRGINLPKEFYVSDVKKLDEPINFSTVYWDYQKVLNAKQSTPLSFHTGDLTGKFKIIVQGITENGFVYGEKEISVFK